MAGMLTASTSLMRQTTPERLKKARKEHAVVLIPDIHPLQLVEIWKQGIPVQYARNEMETKASGR